MARTQAKSKNRTNIRYPISNFFVLLVKAYRVGKKCTTAVYVTVTAVKSTKTGIARIAIFQAGVGPKQSGCQIWVVDLSLVHTADLEADTCAQSGHSIPHSRSKIRAEVESQSCTCPPPTSPRSARVALTAVSKPDGAQRPSTLSKALCSMAHSGWSGITAGTRVNAQRSLQRFLKSAAVTNAAPHWNGHRAPEDALCRWY